jgi:hypothetical protein
MGDAVDLSRLQNHPWSHSREFIIFSLVKAKGPESAHDDNDQTPPTTIHVEM